MLSNYQGFVLSGVKLDAAQSMLSLKGVAMFTILIFFYQVLKTKK